MLVHLALIKITDLWPNFSPPLPPQSLESLTERCDSALLLLGEALESMDAEPMPDNIKVEDSKYHQTSFYFQNCPQNINKHVTFFPSGCSPEHRETQEAHEERPGWPTRDRTAAKGRGLAGRTDQ